MKSKNLLFSLVFLFTLFWVNAVQAGLISHATGANTTTRICPTATYERDCINESFEDWENRIITVEQVNVASHSTYVQNADGTNWADISFSGEHNTLPEVHFYASSNAQERSTGNVFAYQEYTWEGESDTLTIASAFDFSMSAGLWGDGVDSYYSASLNVLTDITLSEYFFPTADWDNDVISSSFYSSKNENITANTLIERSISTTFDVNYGDTFYIYNVVQGGGMNGGWVDSSNTLQTSITAANSTQEQINRAFIANVRPDPAQVPEPSSIALFALAIVGLASRRLKK